MMARKKRPRKSDQRKARKRYRVASESCVSADEDNGVPNGIPNEVLSQILHFCDDEALRNAMQTCHRWYAVINETVGVSLAIGKTCLTTTRRPLQPFQPIDMISRLGVKECYVGELTNIECLPFGYPQTLRKIVFDGPITTFNFVTLLSPVPKLTSLTIHFSTLENIKVPPGVIHTTSLKHFKLTSHEISIVDYEWAKAVAVTNNLIQLLLNLHSTQLTNLILDLVYLASYDLKVTKAILTTLVRHKGTMRTFQFYSLAKLREPDPPGAQEEDTFPELSTPESNLFAAKAVKEAVYLHRISYAGLRGAQSDIIWNQLIKSQKRLKELFYMNDNRNNRATGIPCLKMNSESLAKVLFHINAVDEAMHTSLLDCRIFQNFKNLSHLLIRGRKLIFRNFMEGDNEDDDVVAIARVTLKIPLLKNIELIPNTVRVLSLRDIYVETESLSRFRIWFPPSLAKFRLVDTGCVGDYGIKPDTLLEIMKMNTIQEVEVIRSFNRMSWEHAQGKDINEDLMISKVKSEWEFHWTRDTDGTLHLKNEAMFNYGVFETALRANDVCEVVFQ